MHVGYIPPVDEAPTEAEAEFAVEEDVASWEIMSWDWTEADWVEDAAAILESYDVECSAIGVWGANSFHPEEGDRAREGFERALDVADRFDAPTIITGAEVLDPRADDAWEEGIAHYGEVLDRVRERGMEVAFYVAHGPNLLQGPESMRRFLEELPKATLKLDPANLLLDGLDPVSVLSEFGEDVGHFHVKDRITTSDHGEPVNVDQVPAGLGEVPWGPVIDMLYVGGYDGPLSVEPHGEYWGHEADDETRREGIVMAREHLQRKLKPSDRD